MTIIYTATVKIVSHESYYVKYISRFHLQNKRCLGVVANSLVSRLAGSSSHSGDAPWEFPQPIGIKWRNAVACKWHEFSWWRHQTCSALLAPCAGNSSVTGEIPAQRPETRSFNVFFDLRLNKRLSKQSWGWRFKTPSRSLWRHCRVYQIPQNLTNRFVRPDGRFWMVYPPLDVCTRDNKDFAFVSVFPSLH